MSKAVVLLSGGMDSLVTAGSAAKENNELFFIHFSYGQITAEKELECFHKLVDFFNPEDKLIVNLDFFKAIGGSKLINSESSFSPQENDYPNIPQTYVPFRNGCFLALSTSWAEVINAEKIYIGAVEADSSGYPDCRKVFFHYYNKALTKGTSSKSDLSIITPLIDMNKSEIIKLGQEMNLPFELSWSCYFENKKACGICDSCRLRIRAFKKAGLKDPLDYKIHIKW